MLKKRGIYKKLELKQPYSRAGSFCIFMDYLCSLQIGIAIGIAIEIV